MTTLTDTAPTSETHTLLDQLAAQQSRILGIVAGLDDDAMRRVVLPSGWSCAGMLQHLTLTTRFWCAAVVAGQPHAPHPDDEFAVDVAVMGAELVRAYEVAARRGAELARGLPLSAPPAWWPEGEWGGWRLDTVHEVLLHLLVETATHAGHLDAARELIDGRTWDYAEGRLSEGN